LALGFVERIELPIARSVGGRRPYLCALGRRGEPVVAQRLGQNVTRVQRRRLDRLSSVFVDHDLKIAAFWANLIALLRSTRARLGRWLPERELRARKIRIYDPRTGWWLPVLPDAAFEVVYPDGSVQACLLEVDLGTLTLKRFRRKVRAFELDLAQGLGAVLPVSSFEVLMLTHSQGRLQQLWRAARDKVPPERWGAYSFGTFDLLEPSRFREADWVTAEDNLVPLLYDDTFPAAATEPTAVFADADHEMADAAPAPATRTSGAKGNEP
jgi:hypothetical protein